MKNVEKRGGKVAVKRAAGKAAGGGAVASAKGKAAKKVAKKKAVVAAERVVNYVRSLADLAEALGYSRRQVQNWRKDPRYVDVLPKSRADGRYSVVEWKRFVEEQGLRGDEENEDLELKREQMRLKNAREQFRLERDRGEWVRREVVAEGLTRNLSKLFVELHRVFVNELPGRLRGLSETEISRVCAEELTRMTERAEEQAKQLTEGKQ